MNKETTTSDHHRGQSEQAAPKSEVALREEAMLSFWEEHDIFRQSMELPAGSAPKGEFVFYDGPPFATGLPHYGHILAGTIKDAVPRFQTMNGYRVRRQWGWDCHGLPLENLVETQLGLATKRDIEAYGIKQFNETARDSVLRFADDWRQIVPRLGRFVDMEDDYKTMDSSYTESVWWIFKTLHEKGLVYEGFKSMHLCPRCGTTLSNFEVNQGYRDIKDVAVTVKLPLLDAAGFPTDTSLLVWTTTPWTLPGNLAAAVNETLPYAVVEIAGGQGGTERLILARDRLAQLGDVSYQVVEELSGRDLVGRRYEPPFPWLQEEEIVGGERAWTIYHGDFVELGEQGTGAVHIAPAFGEDDLELAKQHGIPVVHHVDADGRFMPFVVGFAGESVKPKDDEAAGVTHLEADIKIIKALKSTGKLLKKENLMHSYPHCWRCDTPLLNYATNSWFVDVPRVREQLLSANDTIRWVPEHVGKNRFGKWLEGAREWAVSRQRYWGAPLPVWRNPQTTEPVIVGSVEELKAYVPKSGNRYFLARHGESVFNTKELLNVDASVENGMTKVGREQAHALAEQLRGTDIDLIYYSPLQRTRETAELIAGALGLPERSVIADDRLLEMRFGEFEGRSVHDYLAFFGDGYGRMTKAPENGESWSDVKRRVGSFLYEIEQAHGGKQILIVSHNGTLQMLQSAANGDTKERSGELVERDYYDLVNGELRELSFTPLPHNDDYELDLHRPYIDDVILHDGEVRLERVPDVFDCWFESGAMPYGQHHYPFACKEEFEKLLFPAEFIAEGLDQTRGWFYSLLVLGVALFGRSPFENVIVNGLVLAEDGRKMSKKLRNYPNPMDLVAKYGADAMRLYLLSSPIVKAEDLNFSEKEVQELQRKTIGRLHNVLQMYLLYATDTPPEYATKNVLDRWISARCHELVTEVTLGYRKYELDKATRPIIDFIDDLSVWYLRRSRDRLKGEDAEEKAEALATLRAGLRTLALVMAPAMPFYAEHLWQAVRRKSDLVSVHLAPWPEPEMVDAGLLAAMKEARETVRAVLEARVKADIKVRQPIASISGPLLVEELQAVVLDEVNAKTYQVLPSTEPVSIDTTLTPELLAEGAVREVIREVQQSRKELGLQPAQAITLYVDEAAAELLADHAALITRVTGSADIKRLREVDGQVDQLRTVTCHGQEYRVGITLAETA